MRRKQPQAATATHIRWSRRDESNKYGVHYATKTTTTRRKQPQAAVAKSTTTRRKQPQAATATHIRWPRRDESNKYILIIIFGFRHMTEHIHFGYISDETEIA